MKTKLDHLLACLCEECGEVQQVVGKSLRFGIYDHHPIEGSRNLDLLHKEMTDTVAIYEEILTLKTLALLFSSLGGSDVK